MIDVAALNDIRALAASYGAKLIVATKTQPASVVERLHELAPEVIMGENRVQELVQKYDPALEWHMIGRLQTNKVKYIADKVCLIHSLDREDLAAQIDRQAAKFGRIQSVLVEVNMGGEESKGGVPPQLAGEFIAGLVGYEHISIEGVMTVMPRTDDERALARLYGELLSLYEDVKKISQKNADIKYLSAGMSADYKIALDYGANMLRIGRAIFGERPRNTQDI